MTETDTDTDHDADAPPTNDEDPLADELEEFDLGPDPDAEPEPLSASDAVYQRNADGDLIPEAVDIDSRDGPKVIKVRPITKGDALEFRDRWGDRENLDIDDTDELLNEYVVEPDVDWSNPDVKPDIYLGAVSAVVTMALGQRPSNQFHADVRDELSKRADEGN